jgi:glycosyltransferase involved in cell wall biosynthesis
MPTVCLNMIVKDESAVIERCLSSVIPLIDQWVIVDTGSSDNTPHLVQQTLEGIPGELHHRPWVNFGHNRTEALQLARGRADYLFFIDADERLEIDPAFRKAAISGPALSLEMLFAGTRYDRVALVSSDLPWRWEGVLHEYLDCGERVPQPRLHGLSIIVSSDGARSADPQKFQRDAALLEAALEDEPDNPRYMFYLAQSYRDAGELERAKACYARRAQLGGWDEEVWCSLHERALLAERTRESAGEVILHFLRAFENRPSRAESSCELSRVLGQQGLWGSAHIYAAIAADLPAPEDRLFVNDSYYTWRSCDQLALTSYYTDQKGQAARLWRDLLRNPALPAGERSRISTNLNWVSD